MTPYVWEEHCANSGIKKKLQSRHCSQKSYFLVERMYTWQIIQLECDSCNNRILSNRILCSVDNGLVDLPGEGGKGYAHWILHNVEDIWAGESALPRLVKDRKVVPVDRAEYGKPLRNERRARCISGHEHHPSKAAGNMGRGKLSLRHEGSCVPTALWLNCERPW